MSKDPKSGHYDVGGIETLDVIRAKLTPAQYHGYLLGNVIKYALRLNHKGDSARDAEKVRYYAEWLAQEFADAAAPDPMEKYKAAVERAHKHVEGGPFDPERGIMTLAGGNS